MKEENRRQRLLDRIWAAQGIDAKEIRECLLSEDVKYLTRKDFQEIKENILSWERNNAFGHDLDVYKVDLIFARLIRKFL